MYGSLDGAIRILFEPLFSGVVPLDSDPSDVLRLPHPDDSRAVAWRQRNVLLNAAEGLARPHVRVGCGQRERLSAQRAQEFEPDVCRRVGKLRRT